MKKTLVALSVLAAATSAQAIELYNQDGVTVGVTGDIEIVYMNSFEESSMKQEIQDADFGFDVRYAVNDEFSVGGFWQFDGADGSNNETTKNGDAYVAVYSNTYGSIKFGRVCTAIDDAGIGDDYQYGIQSFFDNQIDVCSDEAVRYDYDNGSFYATLGLSQDKINDTGMGGTALEDDSTYYDAKLGYRVGDFDLTGFVAQGDVNYEAKDDAGVVTDTWVGDDSLLGAELRFSGIENVSLAVAYYSIESEVKTILSGTNLTQGEKAEADTVALAANYTMNNWLFAAGYSATDINAANSDMTHWYLNAGYTVAPGAVVYAELGGEDSDEVGYDSDTALAIGVKAEF